MRTASTLVSAFISVCLTCLGEALADTEAAPAPWMTTSSHGDYLFKMAPAKWREDGDRFVVDREAFGVAYGITDDGELEEAWRTEGWYTFEGYLSDDGRHFVRIGPWASDLKNHTDLAIAFYKDGELLRSYRVRDLIRQPDLLEMTVSHYKWRPLTQSEPNGFCDESFHLVMIDKTSYEFDYKSGDITNRGRDEQAKGELEILNEERTADAQRGQKLLEASALAASLEPHFDIKEVELSHDQTTGCSLAPPTWNAALLPKLPYAHDVSVLVHCEVKVGRHIVFPLAPQRVIEAIERAFAHPLVKNRLAGDATGIRLRMQGDRLHWDTPELVDFIRQISGAAPREDDLSHWAYFIIDGHDPRYTSIYLNTITGDLITEDRSAWPWRPYVVNADGVRSPKLDGGHGKPKRATPVGE